MIMVIQYLNLKRYSRTLVVNVVIILCLFATGCQTAPPPVDNLDSLIDRLDKAGVNAGITDHAVRNIHLSVEGIVLLINGDNVHLFEYEDATTAILEFKALTGSNSGLVFFKEDEPPLTEIVSLDSRSSVYHSGRFVVLYNGDDEDITDALSVSLGQPSQVQ